MTENNRGRSAMPTNFWSFNFIDVKGLAHQFGSKTLTGFKIAEVEGWICNFPLFYYIKDEKTAPLTFNTCIFKASEGFATKLKWHAHDSYEIEWSKVGGITDLPLSFPVKLKRPFYYIPYYPSKGGQLWPIISWPKMHSIDLEFFYLDCEYWEKFLGLPQDKS